MVGTSDTYAEVLTSFLACADNSKMGDTILALAENLNSGEIFRKYAQLIETTEQSIDKIHTIYQRIIPRGNITRQQLVQNLLKQGERLLQQAVAAEADDDLFKLALGLEQEQILVQDVLEELEIFIAEINEMVGEIMKEGWELDEEQEREVLGPFLDPEGFHEKLMQAHSHSPDIISALEKEYQQNQNPFLRQ